MDKNEYHARHILVASKDQAEQVIKKLKSGAKFEDVAKAQSTDTGSKNNGGDLGWFTTSRMVKPFADAVKNLKKGEISPSRCRRSTAGTSSSSRIPAMRRRRPSIK